MCGIFGTTIKEIDTSKVLDTLKHRGPDDKGVWQSGKVSFCHTRLSIIDISNGGHQPMLNHSRDIGIVFNGEIYNFQELKKELAGPGTDFESHSDTEVVLKGYEKWGNGIFNKLRGMWAIAIYDSKNRKLILSRDQFGIKPLCYSIDGEKIIFSSEVKAITPYVKLSPNTDDYFLFYNFGYFPGEKTAFREIKKVLPGQIISFDLIGGKTAFNTIPLNIEEGEKIIGSDIAANVISENFIKSVEKHFVSDVPVGLLLSGGADSAFIATASKKLGQNPTCFHVSTDNNSLDTGYAEKISKHFGLPFEKIVVDNHIFKEQYNRIWDVLDQPTADVSFLPTSMIFSAVEGKSKVVLSGEGGDELFGGYLRHKNFARFNRMGFKNFFPDISGISKISMSLLNPILSRVRNFAGPLESLGSEYLYNARPIDLGINQKQVFDFMAEYYSRHYYKDVIQPNLFFDLFMYLADNLMYKGDMSSMAYGIEARVPFLDKVFFNAVSNIDPKLRLSEAFQGKRILKKSLEQFLPEELIYRKKSGFGINIEKYGGDLVYDDLKKAMKYHNKNSKILGIDNINLKDIMLPARAEMILKKFPRFAFALISNHKIMEKYLN